MRTKAIRGLGGSQGISGGMGRRKPSLFPRLMNGRETTMLTDFNKEHCKFEISMVGTVPKQELHWKRQAGNLLNPVQEGRAASLICRVR